MAGTTILINLKRGDEVVVYAYTGTWLADFAMNHYTHWVGLLLKVSSLLEISLGAHKYFDVNVVKDTFDPNILIFNVF